MFVVSFVLGRQRFHVDPAVFQAEAVKSRPVMGRAVTHIIFAVIGIAPARRITISGQCLLDDIGPGFALAGIVRAQGQAAVVFVDLPYIHPGIQPAALQ